MTAGASAAVGVSLYVLVKLIHIHCVHSLMDHYSLCVCVVSVSTDCVCGKCEYSLDCVCVLVGAGSGVPQTRSGAQREGSGQPNQEQERRLLAK